MENLKSVEESHINEKTINGHHKEIKPLGIDNFMELLKKVKQEELEYCESHSTKNERDVDILITRARDELNSDKDLKDKLPGIFAKIQLLLDGYETTFENRMIEFLYLKIEIGELVNSLDEKLKNNGNSYCSLFCSNPQSCHPDDCYIKKFRDAAYEREKPIGTFSMETGKYGSF